VYVPGPASPDVDQLDLALFDRSGTVTALNLPPALYETPRVSPDGKRLAVAAREANASVIYVYDLSGATARQKLTFGGKNRFPIWSPDSERVAYQSDREGDLAIFSQRADGTGAVERLTRPPAGASHVPDSWWGDRILFSETIGSNLTEHVLSVRNTTVEPFADLRSELPIDATFSPDGRWVAYQSGRPGNNAVYVKPFPATGATYQVSKGNAHHPAWLSNHELIIIPAQAPMLAVSVDTIGAFGVGSAQVSLPIKGIEGGPNTVRNYDVTPDGRFVGVFTRGSSTIGTAPPIVQVVLNWFEDLRQRVPVK
jgi:hypothetical protein